MLCRAGPWQLALVVISNRDQPATLAHGLGLVNGWFNNALRTQNHRFLPRSQEGETRARRAFGEAMNSVIDLACRFRESAIQPHLSRLPEL